MPITDLQPHAPASQMAEAERLARDELQRPFDLASDLMLRAALLKRNADTHVLLLTLHHIATDGWSFGNLCQELAVLYDAHIQGKPSPLTTLPIQYADFAYWQRQWEQSDAFAQQLAYWKEQLAGVPERLALPTDRAHPSRITFDGGVVPFRLDAELTARLRQLSQQADTTLFMTLLAAFQALLARYSGQNDIVVGTAIANRNRRELEPLIGFFVNMLALRADVSGNPTFRELLGQVRQVTQAAYENQDLPFERLVEVLQPARSMEHQPLVQVGFALQNMPASHLELSGLHAEPVDLALNTSRLDLEMFLTETEGELDGMCLYKTVLFEASTIERMWGHYQTLLQQVVNDPEQRLSELPLLTEAEQHQLLVAWNDTHVPFEPGACVYHGVEQQAQRTPHAMAIEYEGQQLTYDAFNQRANQLAHFLRQRGVGPETRVGICLERSVEMIVALLGICKSGGAYVPLDPAYPRDRLAFMMQDSQMRLLVTQTSLLEQLPIPDGLPQMVCLDRDWPHIATMPSDNPVVQVAAEQLAYIIYTSGSSGAPKAVMVPHRGLRNLVNWYLREFDVNASDRCIQFVNLSFDAYCLEIWPTLSRGAKLHLVKPELMSVALRLQDWLIKHDITLAHIPTPIAEQLIRLTWPDAMALRLLLTGGEQLHLSGSASPLPFQFVNLYGPTENSVVSTWYVVSPDSPAIPPIGRALDNQCMYVVDGHLQPVPVGVAGELYVGGIGVGRGYLNRPGLTAEKFVPNPFAQGRLYRTGDLVRYLPDGNLEFLGRIDNQVKLRGFRIELGEIEAVLSQHEWVKEAVVTLYEADGNRRLAAYVTGDITPEQLAVVKHGIKARLPNYMVPSQIVVLNALPLNVNGKIDRNALPAPGNWGEDAYEAPRNEIEQRLAEVWSTVLKRQQIGIHDDFFDTGGHSLLAIELLSHIQHVFDQPLPLDFLFQNPTIAQLAAQLGAEEKTSVTHVLPIQPTGTQTPLFCVAGANGYAFYFRDLATCLGADQPLYGLEAPGRDGFSPLPDSVEDHASQLVAALRQVQPQGPHLLAGYSAGCAVAFEMASQLEQQGETVRQLIILDTGLIAHPEHFTERSELDMIWYMVRRVETLKAVSLGLDYQQLVQQPDDQARWQLAAEHLHRPGVLPEYESLSLLQTGLRVGQGLMDNYTIYHPARPIAAPIVLYRAKEIDALLLEEHRASSHYDLPDWGWQAHTQGSVHVSWVPGNHGSILYEPHVQVLASDLQRRMDFVASL
nr:KrmA [uncultured bacterium]